MKSNIKHAVFLSFLKRELERTVDLILQTFKLFLIFVPFVIIILFNDVSANCFIIILLSLKYVL